MYRLFYISYLSSLVAVSSAIFCLAFHLSAAVKYLAVNQSNCRIGANLTNPCGFIIDVKGDINEDIRCQLHFNTSNATVEFSNQIIFIKDQANSKCPHFSLQFLTSLRTYRLATTCGGEIDPVNKTIKSFISAELIYDLQGLTGRNESRLKMSLTILNPDPNACADPDKPAASDWSIGYYIGIPIAIIAIIILIAITIICVILIIRRKRKCRRNRAKNELPTDEPALQMMDKTEADDPEL